MEKLVSIIIPVYGVQAYVGMCMNSLLSQSYKNIQYIVVDDCSPDSSLEIIKSILEKYPERRKNVKLIKHNTNLGLPAARNTGLEHADGEYIFHCDSDDWVGANLVSELVAAIERNDADIVYCDYYLSFSESNRYMKQPNIETSDDCIRAMLSGKMKFNVWNKLVKSKLYFDYNITFPSGKSMGEDMTMIQLFCHAKNITYVSDAFYYYVQTNPNALTKRMTDDQIEDIISNIDSLVHYLHRFKGESIFKEEIDYFKLNMKLPFLISTDKRLYQLWRKLFQESNYAIRRNKDFSFRIKFIQYAALYRQDWIIRLYNFLVVKFVYGFIYR